MTQDTTVAFGDALKATKNGDQGIVEAMGIRFTGPRDKDLDGEYFTDRTDYGPHNGNGMAATLNHRMPMITSATKAEEMPVLREYAKRLFANPVETEVTPSGIIARHILDLADEYEAMIFDMATKNKLRWSSGAAGHMVDKTKDGEITTWHVAEWAMTPIAADPNLPNIVPLKSLEMLNQMKPELVSFTPGEEETVVLSPGDEPEPEVDVSDEWFKTAPGDTAIVMSPLPPLTSSYLSNIPGVTEDEESLHVTVAYFGEVDNMDDSDVASLIRATDRLAREGKALTGNLGGVGRFAASPSSWGKDVIYASVDIPGLFELRAELLKCADAPPSMIHGFTPHVTLAYVEPGDPSPIESWVPVPTAIEKLTVGVGDKYASYKMRGTSSVKSAGGSATPSEQSPAVDIAEDKLANGEVDSPGGARTAPETTPEAAKSLQLTIDILSLQEKNNEY